jgi:hypothetical protein
MFYWLLHISVLLHFLHILAQPGRLGGVELASPISNRGYDYKVRLRAKNQPAKADFVILGATLVAVC